MNKLIELEIKRPKPGVSNIPAVTTHVKKALPFVENKNAILVHRVRAISLHSMGRWKTSVSIKLWCGNTFNHSGDDFTLYRDPPKHKIVCERCEIAATRAGKPTSRKLADRKVHLGGVHK